MKSNWERIRQYRERAAEMRAIAEKMQTAKARQAFFVIADQYDEMARTAAYTEKGGGGETSIP